jgi:uncharacterized membrane protein YdjX (TVP38/TMEM64 family)
LDRRIGAGVVIADCPAGSQLSESLFTIFLIVGLIGVFASAALLLLQDVLGLRRALKERGLPAILIVLVILAAIRIEIFI